jgi:hypothetical protein
MNLPELKLHLKPEKAWDHFKTKAFVNCPKDIDDLVKQGFEESINESEKYERLFIVVSMVQAKAGGYLKAKMK